MNSALLLSLAVLIGLTHAFPEGPPVCTVGGPAPGDVHLTRGAEITGTGPLAPAGFKVSFNGVDISTLSAITVNATVSYLVEVEATTELPFKGVLMIVSKPTVDTTGVLSLIAGETLLQISSPCLSEARSGVTHNSRDFKTKASATMIFEEAITDLKFDVNVVVQNNETGSYYYHDQYTFNVVVPAAAPGTGTSEGCGLFGLSIFCPFTFCGFFGRLLLGPRDC